jgi:hypothetical protein
MHFATVWSAVAAVIVTMGIMAMLGFITAASMVVASAIVMEAISAPAVGIAPASPGTHAKEDATVEIRWPIKSVRSASIGRSLIIAPLANRWNADFDDGGMWNADADDNLRASRRHQGQTRK